MRDLKFEAKLRRMPPREGQAIGCLEWTGATQKSGHGFLGRRINKKSCTFRVHRYVWFLHYGVWPDPCALHHCDNPPCCEITHLFEGTGRDNLEDMTRKGRRAIGDRNGAARYSDELVQQVREATGLKREIAKRFGLSASQVGRIKTGKSRVAR